jgi:hypothetical protein
VKTKWRRRAGRKLIETVPGKGTGSSQLMKRNERISKIELK